MTLFDQFSEEQREYAIRHLRLLVEQLSLTTLEQRLIEDGKILTIGTVSSQAVQQSILEFALNHFGTPYSHEAGEKRP